MTRNTPCPDDRMLQSFVLGRASAAEMESLREHLKGCEHCTQKLKRWRTSDRVLDPLPTGPYRPDILPSPGAAPSPEMLFRLEQNITTLPTANPSSLADQPTKVEGEPVRLPSISGYAILGILGRGGMGMVYQARHRQLNRVVALKMILSGSYAGAEELIRFHVEAEAVARLQHPNIVQIFEVGEHTEPDGRTCPFMALEYVEGGTLATRAAASPLSGEDAAALVEVLARAMHYAHQRGIIHRDLKPANVLLTADGVPKITDFGLAKHLETPSGQTQTGQVMGTPEYMAPEQASGQVRAIRPPTDVYALGAILYAVVTGRPPFRGVTVLETLEQVRQREPVPPSQLQPKLPRDVDTICLKCLQKEPSKRYATAEELADDLQRFLDGKPIKARPIGRAELMVRWCRRYPLVASLLVLLGLALVGAVWGWITAIHEGDAKDVQTQAAREAGDRARQNEEKEKEQRLKTQDALEDAKEQKKKAEAQTIVANTKTAEAEAAEGKERLARKKLEVTLAQRGIMLASQYEFNNNTSLAEQVLEECPPSLRGWEWRYLKRLCSGNGRVLRGHQDRVAALAFSADGRRLASSSMDQVARVWDVGTGKELYASPAYNRLPDPRFRPSIALSPDGRLVSVPIPFTGPTFTPEREAAILRDVTAGKNLPALKTPNHTTLVTRVVFSPDGKQVAGICESFQGRLRLWESATAREIKTLPGNPRKADDLAFSPDGKLLASIGMDNSNKGELQLWDLAEAKSIFTFTGEVFDSLAAVAFSPDGKHLAVCGKNNFPKVQDGRVRQKGILKVWDVATRKEVQGISFPKLEEPVTGLAFSPDSRLLAVHYGEGKVYVFDLQSRTTALTTNGWSDPNGDASYRQMLAFSPDSKQLALAGFYTVQVWDVATQKQELDLRGHSYQVLAVVFSPDGRYLASGAADNTIRLWDLQAARRPRALGDGKNCFDWAAISSDGEMIAIAEHAPVGPIRGQIKLWKTTTGELLRTLAGHQDMIQGLAFSPDGKRLASSSSQAVILWDAATGKELLTFKGHNRDPRISLLSGARSLAFCPDGKHVATCGADGTVQLWSADTGAVVFRWEEKDLKSQPIRGLAFDGTGKRLAVSFRDEIKIFDLQTRKPACTITQTLNPSVGANAMALSPDGILLATVGPTGTPVEPRSLTEIHLWDATTGKHLFDLRGHFSTVGSVAFSPEGERLVSAGWDGALKLWDVPSRQEVLTLRGPRGVAAGAAFSADASRLISLHALYTGTLTPSAGEVRIWDARPLAP